MTPLETGLAVVGVVFLLAYAVFVYGLVIVSGALDA